MEITAQRGGPVGGVTAAAPGDWQGVCHVWSPITAFALKMFASCDISDTTLDVGCDQYP